MARTGISITVSNSTFGRPPRVDANTMLIVPEAVETTIGTLAFSLDVSYMLYTVEALDDLGITETNNPVVFKHVTDFYQKAGSGTLLWLVGSEDTETAISKLPEYVRSTVINGFQYRPRQILIANFDNVDYQAAQAAIDSLYREGFSTVMMVGSATLPLSNINTGTVSLPDLSLQNAPMVGTVIVTDVQGREACVGMFGGLMASLGVGTSIGNTSLPTVAASLYFLDGSNTPCAAASLDTCNLLGDKQYIFARTRPPRNGLWINDGATAVDSATALSTLEAGRTIASMVDELRSFFTPFINGNVPVASGGVIQSGWKAVVLEAARSFVIQRFIEAGDISDASLQLEAEGGDFLASRTFEVTLGILPAFSLRWVNGQVFYVKQI